MSTGSASDLKVLEHSTLKVPYEVLNKKFRVAQKVLDREVTYVTQAGNEIERFLANYPSVSASPNADENAEESCSTESTRKSIGEILNTAGAESQDQDMDVSCSNSVTAPQPMDQDDSLSSSSALNEAVSTRSFTPADTKITTEGPKGKDVAKLLGVLVERLGSMKRKAGESIQEELDAAKAVRKRVQHLKNYATMSENPVENPMVPSALPFWKRTRLNRMLVDHLLREGMYETANFLAKDLNISDLTNVEVFMGAKEVEESLKRHETVRTVAWCHENKSKLRKLQSTLELEIRIQEFVELVRSGKRTDAVKYARKYLADASTDDNAGAVKKCMGLLAFSTSTTLSPYAELLSPERWHQLITLFRQEHARLFNLTATSVLGAVVQAGLASLKTPQCYRSSTKNPNCPVCTDPLSDLATCLPYAHCAHSQLVCAISGESLNEYNPPLMLPSGYVYGTKSLQDHARNNDGKVFCPRSNKVFNLSEADKVYVM